MLLCLSLMPHCHCPLSIGLEDIIVDKSRVIFANVGERCNIAGSIQFKKLILAGKFQDAMAVARKQVEVRVAGVCSIWVCARPCGALPIRGVHLP